jgi:hypothetical protein
VIITSSEQCDPASATNHQPPTKGWLAGLLPGGLGQTGPEMEGQQGGGRGSGDRAYRLPAYPPTRLPAYPPTHGPTREQAARQRAEGELENGEE